MTQRGDDGLDQDPAAVAIGDVMTTFDATGTQVVAYALDGIGPRWTATLGTPAWSAHEVGAAGPQPREGVVEVGGGQDDVGVAAIDAMGGSFLRPANAWPTGGATRPCRTRPVTG
jgi:hypothetical protein